MEDDVLQPKNPGRVGNPTDAKVTQSPQSSATSNQTTVRDSPDSAPKRSTAPAGPQTLSEKFRRDYAPMTTHTYFGVIDATLKRPGQIAHALVNGTDKKIGLYLISILLICLAGIGGMMGSFSGEAQLWVVPLKTILGTVASAIICLPSLYILLCLSGGEQSVIQVGRLMLLSLVLAGILFLGFMPVAWIFSQATESVVFMGILYLAIWGTGLFFGLRLLKTTFEFLNRKPMGALALWVVVFSLVLLQMSTTLRPIIGSYEPIRFSEKRFFISHWIELIER